MTSKNAENPFLKSFADPEAVARYQSGPPKFVPGFDALHTMTTLLLAETLPDTAKILVLGAGGGLELKVMADTHSGWTFEGVDPAGEMLKLAADTLGEDAGRVDFVEGYIDDASDGPFDGAVCLLTLHFLDVEERQRTCEQIRKRLKPGAPFVAAHSCLPEKSDERDLWLGRYAAYALAAGAPPEMVAQARQGVASITTIYPASVDAEVFRRAGFNDVSQFFMALTWHGWVCYA